MGGTVLTPGSIVDSFLSLTKGPPGEPGEAAEEDAPPGLRPGQGTAIVTGVISIAIGVAYLALVSVFDQRGAVLQPPPPEAFL